MKKVARPSPNHFLSNDMLDILTLVLRPNWTLCKTKMFFMVKQSVCLGLLLTAYLNISILTATYLNEWEWRNLPKYLSLLYVVCKRPVLCVSRRRSTFPAIYWSISWFLWLLFLTAIFGALVRPGENLSPKRRPLSSILPCVDKSVSHQKSK